MKLEPPTQPTYDLHRGRVIAERAPADVAGSLFGNDEGLLNVCQQRGIQGLFQWLRTSTMNSAAHIDFSSCR